MSMDRRKILSMILAGAVALPASPAIGLHSVTLYEKVSYLYNELVKVHKACETPSYHFIGPMTAFQYYTKEKLVDIYSQLLETLLAILPGIHPGDKEYDQAEKEVRDIFYARHNNQNKSIEMLASDMPEAMHDAAFIVAVLRQTFAYDVIPLDTSHPKVRNIWCRFVQGYETIILRA